MIDRIMHRFSVWFASSQGVFQTFIVTTAWVILERLFPTLDPNGFWFLYILTLYSAQTQPVLALAANVSAENSSAVLKKAQETQVRIREVQDSQTLLMRNQADMMRALLAISEHIHEEVQEIAETVEDLTERNETDAGNQMDR